jgi:hypothetical protein
MRTEKTKKVLFENDKPQDILINGCAMDSPMVKFTDDEYSIQLVNGNNVIDSYFYTDGAIDIAVLDSNIKTGYMMDYFHLGMDKKVLRNFVGKITLSVLLHKEDGSSTKVYPYEYKNNDYIYDLFKENIRGFDGIDIIIDIDGKCNKIEDLTEKEFNKL